MTIAHDIVAALSGGFTQNARLLVLHTPLGTDRLVAERATVEEAIGPAADAERPAAGFRMVVDALSTDAHLELKTLVGQPVLLELLTAASRTELRPFHGHVTEASLLGSDGGLARYRLVVEPWLAFLAHRVDAWVFQGKSVIAIVEEIFVDHSGQGRLVPAWRWELEDRAVYAERSICIQYGESDLDFVLRLLREEGLFFWFEHAGAAGDDGLGAHTLVIADHNAAFRPAPQERLRYTQPGPTLAEDSVVRWSARSALHAASLSLASHDYRSLSMRPQQQAQAGDGGVTPVPSLALDDVPGLYAYEDAAQGERLARRQMEAIDAQRATAAGEATVRTLAPAVTFTLEDHPVHDGRDAERDRFVALAVTHRARNNVRADHKAALRTLAGAIAATLAEGPAGYSEHHRKGETPSSRSSEALPNQAEEPLYACRFNVQRAAVPVRIAAVADDSGIDGVPDPRLHPRPTVHGVQTAIVVGVGGEPLTTDRDHRVKVQFHWQRGARAGHRLDHPSSGDNAPASEASGTWVRVAERVAGANWGGVFTPRIGQEVLVQFVAGDIDRPVVVGVVYNGSGTADGQGNRVAAGGSGATGNATAWFPGGQREGKLESHAHPAVLAGYKSQELSTSQSGAGGHNQLVFDDSPAGSRIELSTTTEQTRLQLGHLLQQDDNRRLQPRGHGIDLTTAAWGAVRAGSGLLLSAHGKPGSTAAGSSLESREPQTQLESGRELVHALAESAQKHKAMVVGEPGIVGAKPGADGPRLKTEVAFDAAIESLSGTDQRGDAGSGGGSAGEIGGGSGRVAAWSRPDLVVAGPKGVAAVTPATLVVSAGNTATWSAGQDVQLAAQANHAWSVHEGLVFFTGGRATASDKPNTETGIRLHAATGNVNAQSQTGATRLTADRKVEVASTTGLVRVAAPTHVLLTAMGAALDIQPSSITLKGPGKIEFKASMKVLAGAGSASRSLDLTTASYKPCAFRMSGADAAGAALVPVGAG